MRTTLNIDATLLTEAASLTGETEKTSLVRLGLNALIEREAARRLSKISLWTLDRCLASASRLLAPPTTVKFPCWYHKLGWNF